MEGCQETELVACAKARVSFKFAGGAFDSAQVERGAREGECNSLILSCAACCVLVNDYLLFSCTRTVRDTCLTISPK